MTIKKLPGGSLKNEFRCSLSFSYVMERENPFALEYPTEYIDGSHHFCLKDGHSFRAQCITLVGSMSLKEEATEAWLVRRLASFQLELSATKLEFSSHLCLGLNLSPTIVMSSTHSVDYDFMPGLYHSWNIKNFTDADKEMLTVFNMAIHLNGLIRIPVG